MWVCFDRMIFHYYGYHCRFTVILRIGQLLLLLVRFIFWGLGIFPIEHFFAILSSI